MSKILRQRDKYMNPQPKEESVSPGKKSRAKLPDFEKTLTNWVRNQQKKRLPISDEDLRKQAQVFSFSRSDQAVLSSTSWLEKFKHKNHLAPQKGDGDVTLVDSSTTSLAETPVNSSPASSNGVASPSMSIIDELAAATGGKAENPQDFFDFEGGKSPLDHSPESGRGLDEDLDQSAPHNLLSAISSELGRGSRDSVVMLEAAEDISGAYGRQRSQTYPHVLGLGGDSRPPSSGPNAPSLPVRSLTAMSPDTGLTSIDPRQMMKRHKSVPDIHYPEHSFSSSMHPPPLPRSADTSPISNPASPAEDDNIRALHAIKELLQQHPGVAEPDDYLAIGKLMSKLKLLRPPHPMLPGGMHPIDIMDSPRISKKRTILGIST